MINAIIAAISSVTVIAAEIGDGLKAVGAGLAILGALGAGLGIGIATGKAAEAVSRQPDAEAKIRGTLLLGMIFAETVALYATLVAILVLFTIE